MLGAFDFRQPKVFTLTHDEPSKLGFQTGRCVSLTIAASEIQDFTSLNALAHRMVMMSALSTKDLYGPHACKRNVQLAPIVVNNRIQLPWARAVLALTGPCKVNDAWV